MAIESSAPSISGICMSRIARSYTLPLRRTSSAPAPLSTASGIIPHERACSVRIRRLVSLSSTIRSRFPASCGSCPCRCSSFTTEAEVTTIVKWKVDPTPSLLSTHIVPPISSLSRLLIANPRPVPPY